MTAIPDPGCDCDACRGARVTALKHRLRVEALELAAADARVEIARLEHDLAVAVDLAFRRERVLRAVKPLIGVEASAPPATSGRPLELTWFGPQPVEVAP